MPLAVIPHDAVLAAPHGGLRRRWCLRHPLHPTTGYTGPQLNHTSFGLETEAEFLPGVVYQRPRELRDFRADALDPESLERPRQEREQDVPLPQGVGQLAVKEDGVELAVHVGDDAGEDDEAHGLHVRCWATPFPDFKQDVVRVREEARRDLAAPRLVIAPVAVVLHEPVEEVGHLRHRLERERQRDVLVQVTVQSFSTCPSRPM